MMGILSKERIIVAVDVSELHEAMHITKRLSQYVGYFKFGFQLLSGRISQEIFGAIMEVEV